MATDINESELTICAGCLEPFTEKKPYAGLTATFDPLCRACWHEYLFMYPKDSSVTYSLPPTSEGVAGFTRTLKK